MDKRGDAHRGRRADSITVRPADIGTIQAALITVGDELLAGDTENTNATWLASQLADRGVSVERVLVVPDDVDASAEATLPAGSRPLLNDGGLSPGCVVENVYVLPGIPGEMRAMFAGVADEFDGDATSRVLHTRKPEANLIDDLARVREEFGLPVGCYPDRDANHNRLKVSGEDAAAVDAAAAWLITHVGASETPPEPGGGDAGSGAGDGEGS